VLEDYKAAFNRRDAAGIHALWPTVNAKALHRAFDQRESQQLQFGVCDVEVRADRAQASCEGTIKYVPSVGRKAPRVEPWSATFELGMVDGRWIVSSLLSR